MFEKVYQPLATTPTFYMRMVRSFIFGSIITAIALYMGMLGYHYLEHQSWVDAFVNAAMILGSMGPLNPLATTAGKIFAGFYALFCGLAFIFIIGIVFSPVIHRFLHKFHMDADSIKKST